MSTSETVQLVAVCLAAVTFIGRELHAARLEVIGDSPAEPDGPDGAA